MKTIERQNYTATRNACKVCAPLGASLVFKGIEGGMPLLHGSQGCATYVRRYIISHFREPVDIASSNFSETTAIFGGKANLSLALDNVIRQYSPRIIGIATTCLSETIGDDVPAALRAYQAEHADSSLPHLVHVSTPSYAGTHMDGFHRSVRAVVESLAGKNAWRSTVALFPGLVSPADLRYLKEVVTAFALPYTLLPDYSLTLDSPAWDRYHLLPEGGTPLAEITSLGESSASIEFGSTLANTATAAEYLAQKFGVHRHTLCMPVGIRQSDALFAALEECSGRKTPQRYCDERGRLVDAYNDGHKYVFGKRAVVYGEEDLVIGMASFLAEIGVLPVLCASGGESGRFAESLFAAVPELRGKTVVREGVDFMEIEEEAKESAPDLLIGNSKGYPLARNLKIPLVRIGFPVHDRFGGQRILHLGYRGAQELFDRIVNALLERRQDESSVGYMYL